MKRTISAKIIALVLCIIMLVGVLASAAHALSNEAQDHILNALARARIPNAAIAVIQDGETNYILRDSTTDTLFQIGSVSKSFTGFGVLLLEDMGLLSVYDPVNQHLPWFEVRYHGVPVPHEDMAIYHVLQMASGITSDERHFPRPAATESTDAFIARLSQGLDLAFYPAARHVYGNLNYIILGLLIEAVSGQSYDEFMTQHVLHPLGLYNTFTSAQHAYETGLVIGGNRLGFFQLRPWNPPTSSFTIPTGRIFSDITDMTRWAGIHLGVVDVPEQFTRVVQRSHEHNHESDTPFATRDFFYAAGWRIHTEDGQIEHGGHTPGYGAIVRIFPHSGVAVVVLGNLRYESINQFGYLVFDAVESGIFNTVGVDFQVILDIVFTFLTIVGIVYVIMFVRLVIKTMKRLRSGERIKINTTSISLSGLIDPILTIGVAIGFYIIPGMFLNTSHQLLVLTAPASMTIAGIALWINALQSVCSWLVKNNGQ